MIPLESHAWNRDTHQRITEFAFAYLKAYSVCEDTEVAGRNEYNDVFAGCATRMPSPQQSAGYRCSCAEDYCAEDCQKFSGFERYLCVKDCAESEDDPEFESCVANQGEDCTRPYYWDPEYEDAITVDICAPSAYAQTHILWSEQCTELGYTFNHLGISAREARQTVQFYQDFQSTACPLSAYNYKSEPDCDYELPAQNGDDPRGLRDPSDAQPLKSWTVAPFENKLKGPGLPIDPNGDGDTSDGFPVDDRTYRPMTGPLLQTTNWVESDPSSTKLDFSGTILGFHAATPDKFKDLWRRYQLIPLVDDFFTTAGQIATGAGGGALALLAAAGGVVMCALSCPVTIFFGTCDECFEGTYDLTNDILEETDEIIDDIEEAHIVPAWVDYSALGHNLTSTFHFIDVEDLAWFDDIDGWEAGEALGPVGALAIDGLLGLSETIGAFAVRYDYSKSKRSLENYTIRNSDDGMQDSQGRSISYWERTGLSNYVVPPIDNLAYYWWHKWFEGRLNGKAQIQYGAGEYGLMPLGGVLHGVQDATQPFHAWGITVQGHLPYEVQVSNNLDPTLARHRDVENPKFFIDLTSEEGEEDFLTRVGGYLFLIYGTPIGETGIQCTEPCYNTLRPRRLIHWLAERSAEADWDLEWFTDQPLLSPWDYSFPHKYTRETAIPAAVAASIAVLHEGAQDPARYAADLDLTLASFEHAGPVPNGQQAMSYQEIPDGYGSVEPSWECATESDRGSKAVELYFNDEMSGEELLQIAFAEKTRCELAAAGLPVPPDSELDDLGEYQAQRLKISTAWLEHGDTAVVERDLACLYAQGPNELPVGARNRYQERCDGLLDSDGDGVFDQDDGCMTPQSLLNKGYSVASNGCAFSHETTHLPRSNPFLPGAIRKEKP